MPAKKPTKKPPPPVKVCRIYGQEPTGELASLFPDCVLFVFDVDGRFIDVSGFEAATKPCATKLVTPSEAAHTGWIPADLVVKAKKLILAEYGKRWRKLVVITAPVKG